MLLITESRPLQLGVGPAQDPIWQETGSVHYPVSATLSKAGRLGLTTETDTQWILDMCLQIRKILDRCPVTTLLSAVETLAQNSAGIFNLHCHAP